MTVQDILTYLDALAPFATAEAWDNIGLLVGSPATEVRGVVVALDVTPAAIEAAKAVGANLIVSHHPVIFSPLKALAADSLPHALAAAGIAVISTHTNLDKAAGGVNDTLATLLGLKNVRPSEDGMCRIGHVITPTEAAAFAAHVAATLDATVRTNGGSNRIVTVAVCGGSGGDFIPALADKVDAFVTGEVRHHEWLDANARGLTVIEAGHYATEIPVVSTLYHQLTEAFPTLMVTVYDDHSPYTTTR